MPLQRFFFARPCLDVARDLLGMYLSHDGVVLRITEVEAYVGPHDTACHAAKGRTPRNEAMYGPPGTAYVYTCYGIHQLLNLVTDREGHPAAVLIRACEPVEALDVVRARRGGKRGPVLLTGPGKVGAALALDPSWCGHDLCAPGGLTVEPAEPAADVVVGARVGVDYAEPGDRDAPYRLAVAGTRWVSHRGRLSAPQAPRQLPTDGEP